MVTIHELPFFVTIILNTGCLSAPLKLRPNSAIQILLSLLLLLLFLVTHPPELNDFTMS